MYSEEEWSVMREHERHRISISQVAKERGVNWRTARKYMQSPSPPKYKTRTQTPSRLDPFKEHIKERLGKHPFTAQKLYEDIRAMGYTGKYTLVKKFTRQMRYDRAIPAELRYETKPGEQSQVDWFDFGPIEMDGQRKKLSCFSMILGYSRMPYIEYTTDATTPTFIQCHLNAFRFFGGYTENILYDNLKSVVIKRLLKSSDSVWNPLFKDFFTHYGFTVRLCKPGIAGAKTKGKIENTGHFIRTNFFMGLEFSSIPDLNGKGIAWCNKVGERVHGTTNEIPCVRWKEEPLLPIDARPPYQIVLTEHRRVTRDCYISYRGNKYSVPWKCAGREAKLFVWDSKMDVEIGEETVCTHEVVPGSRRCIKVKEHFEGLYKEIWHRNRGAHIRRIEGHGKGEPPIPVLGEPGANVQVQKRDLAVYDAVAERRDGQ